MVLQGSLITDRLDSKILKGNPARVSTIRALSIYLPKQEHAEKKFPVLYLLAPWTNGGRTQLDWRPFKESLPERIERLIEEKRMPPVVVVSPDLYTDFGGSQFIDSSYFGSHGTFIAQELFSYIESKYPVQAGSKHRAIFGRSSGGYGALRIAIDFPDTVSAVAAHSADLGFEHMFGTDLLSLADKLRKFNNDPEEFIAYSRKATKLSGSDIHALMLLGCCGFYSPESSTTLGFRIPIDLYTGEKIPDVWGKWLQQDPVLLAHSKPEGLRRLKYLYVECGVRDQYRLLYGARLLHLALKRQKIPHRYEEFEDDHSGTDYRFDVSIPELVQAIS